MYAGRQIRFGVTRLQWQSCTTSACSWQHTTWYWLKSRPICRALMAIRMSCAASSKRVSAGMSRSSTCYWKRNMILLRYSEMDSPCSFCLFSLSFFYLSHFACFVVNSFCYYTHIVLFLANVSLSCNVETFALNC